MVISATVETVAIEEDGTFNFIICSNRINQFTSVLWKCDGPKVGVKISVVCEIFTFLAARTPLATQLRTIMDIKMEDITCILVHLLLCATCAQHIFEKAPKLRHNCFQLGTHL